MNSSSKIMDATFQECAWAKQILNEFESDSVFQIVEDRTRRVNEIIAENIQMDKMVLEKIGNFGNESDEILEELKSDLKHVLKEKAELKATKDEETKGCAKDQEKLRGYQEMFAKLKNYEEDITKAKNFVKSALAATNTSTPRKLPIH